jgi:hypothetical protein
MTIEFNWKLKVPGVAVPLSLASYRCPSPCAFSLLSIGSLYLGVINGSSLHKETIFTNNSEFIILQNTLLLFYIIQLTWLRKLVRLLILAYYNSRCRNTFDTMHSLACWLENWGHNGRNKVTLFLVSVETWHVWSTWRISAKWVPGSLSPGVKRPGREVDHSPPTSAEVKKVWIYTSAAPYAFMAWCLISRAQEQLYLYTVEFLGLGISPLQGLCLHTQQHRYRINAHRHLCLEWDSSPRYQRSSARRQFMP